MARYAWVFKNATTSTTFTTSVLSASYKTGRQTYMDNWAGGSLIFTIKNDNNQAAGFTVNDKIDFANSTGVYYQRFFVNEIQYSDYPGQVGLSTATISCTDGLNRSGQNTISNLTLFAGQCCEQLDQFTSSGQIANSGYALNGTTYGPGSSKALGLGGTGYSGSVLQRINQNMVTERGIIWYNQNTIYFVARNKLADKTMALSFGRSTASNVIAYQEFQRITLGQNFMNAVSIQPLNNSSYDSFTTNAASVASYGVRGYSLTTVDFTSAQGQGLGQFLANSQSDPAAIRFSLGFTDNAQNSTAISTFVNSWFGSTGAPSVVIPLTYKIQGSSTTFTVSTLIEGMDISMNPEGCSFTVYLSPMTYYQFFTLNSATLGVLNTSRLGW